jgi:hypothetical protein
MRVPSIEAKLKLKREEKKKKEEKENNARLDRV